ncbi:MAG: c-type cytochrome [Bacteroidetes bacterium]|nr:c-type cytochrome [Bacteroidota bacterium]
MKKKNSIFIKINLLMAAVFFNVIALNAQATKQAKLELPSMFDNGTLNIAVLFAIVLVLIVLALVKSTVSLSKVLSQNKGKVSAIALMLLSSVSAFSQGVAAATAKPNPLPDWVFNPAVYLLGFLFTILLVTVYVLYKVNINLLKAMNHDTEVVAQEELQTETEEEKAPGFMRRIYLRMVDSVPVAHEKDILLDHDYDGIKELDNNLPPWWIYGFYVTIIFGVFYLLIYHVSGAGKLQAAEYQQELAVAAQEKEARMRASADNVNEDNVTALADAELVLKGKETFERLCVTCHLSNGGGTVGPNLTDDYWLHGGGIKNIFKTITHGVPNKGMISWSSQLSPKQIQQVASYVLTFKGKNVAGGKEPQGDKWVEEVVAAKDTTAAKNDTTLSAQVNAKDTIK